MVTVLLRRRHIYQEAENRRADSNSTTFEYRNGDVEEDVSTSDNSVYANFDTAKITLRHAVI